MRRPKGPTAAALQRKRSYGLIDAAIGLTWLGIAFGLAFLGYAIHHANRIAVNKERTLIENGLALSRDDMRTNLKSITVWDDAVEKINNHPDPEFIRDNVGAWFSTYIRYPISLVLNGNDTAAYYFANGSEQETAKAAPWMAAIKPLVAMLRREEKADGYAVLKEGGAYEPRMAIDFVRTGNSVALVGVSTIVPNFAKVMPKAGPSALVATIEPLTDGLLKSIARQTLTNKLRFSPTAPRNGTPYVKISPSAHDGVLLWDPDIPSRLIFSGVWEPSLALLAIIVIASLVTCRAAHQMTDKIITSEARAIHLARHDPLTGLPNRNWFAERFKDEVTKTGVSSRSALLVLDLDHFEEVNDTMGYRAGDEMLVQVGKRLQRLVGGAGFVARHGGDAFAIYLKDAAPDRLETFTAQLKRTLEEPHELIGSTTYSSASIGIAVFDGTMTDDTEIKQSADLALNRAKSSHPGAMVLYSEDLDRSAQTRAHLARDIRPSLESGAFDMRYQPLIDAKTGRVASVEALIRWSHPVHGAVSPAIFIPIAEHAGLIREISIWVMERAFTDSKNWDGITLSVNISPLHMKQPTFIDDMKNALYRTGADPKRIGLEITEGILLEQSDAMNKRLGQLHDLGFKIVLDDFGIGYSSLDYLHRYRFDRIKIDKSFVQGLDWVTLAPAIVHAVVSLSHMSGADVVAEGVETEQQYEFIKQAGCDLIQGFYFYEPLTPAEITDLIRQKEDRGDVGNARQVA